MVAVLILLPATGYRLVESSKHHRRFINASASVATLPSGRRRSGCFAVGSRSPRARRQNMDMDSAMKFAAHQRGAARTLVMVPGAGRATPNGVVRDLSAQVANADTGEIRAREVPGARSIVCRAGQRVFGPGGGGEAVYLIRRGCVVLFKSL